ncbi:MAG TPA: hypothetical protein VG963_12365, partial [Polyangiaceae bacterium]|nr:hypothetical protein [Polyangiaceae bacterium]
RRALLLLSGVVLGLSPARALACAACSDPRDPNQGAFLIGTIMLSLLPPSMFLGLALFLRHQLRNAAKSKRAVPRASRVRLPP